MLVPRIATTPLRSPATPRIYLLSFTAFFASLFLSSAIASAQSETVLYTFSGAHDGAFPYSTLVRDAQGNFYGTTLAGGASVLWGSVFEVTATGKEIILHNFSGKKDGASPTPSLVRAARGNLYGTTSGGGRTGNGEVFEISPDGTMRILYNFTGGIDGKWPQAGLVADAKGNLYGTTYYGGAFGNGVVFRVTPNGQESVWHHFRNQEDGGHPLAGALIRDAAGNLYGTTSTGGAANQGTVFQLMPNGTLNTLHSFLGGNDGTRPESGLIRDSSGNLYGTTSNGGGTADSGVVYKVAPDGSETILYAFTGGLDGAFPMGGVTRDGAGALYGTTVGGGAAAFGTIFKLTPGGVETVLYSFTDGADGAAPWGGLIRDKSGNFYGTSSSGGAAQEGTVFELVP